MSTSRSRRTCGWWSSEPTRQSWPFALERQRDPGHGSRHGTSSTAGQHLSSHPAYSRPARHLAHPQTCATTRCCTNMTGNTGQDGSRRPDCRTSRRRRDPFILTRRRPFTPRSSATASRFAILSLNSEDLQLGTVVRPFEIEVHRWGLLASRAGFPKSQPTGKRFCGLDRAGVGERNGGLRPRS